MLCNLIALRAPMMIIRFNLTLGVDVEYATDVPPHNNRNGYFHATENSENSSRGFLVVPGEQRHFTMPTYDYISWLIRAVHEGFPTLRPLLMQSDLQAVEDGAISMYARAFAQKLRETAVSRLRMS